MARRKRFHFSSAFYHVMLRGNDGQDIFFSDSDRLQFCLLMQEGVERYGHRIHGFCFMSNHVHLAIQVGDITISRIIQNLAFRYTKHINRQQKRIGHLFQGRFKSILVSDGDYFKELIRYIHLNPVRAGIVKLPIDYRWSSHRAYMHQDEFTWLTRENLLKKFSAHDLSSAISSYEHYILKGIGVISDLDFKSGNVDGMIVDDDFFDEAIGQISPSITPKISLEDLIAKVCEQCNVNEMELSKPGKHPNISIARALLAVLVGEIDYLSLKELAEKLQRDSSSISKLGTRLLKKSVESQSHDILNKISTLRDWIRNQPNPNL